MQNKTKGFDYAFRPLRNTDLNILHLWLNLPHMRNFYQTSNMSYDDVKLKFSPRINGEVPTHCHAALINGRPVGKFQCYKIIDYPSFASEIGINDGISVDLFIGDLAYLNKGHGKALLRTYINQVVFNIFPQEHKCYIIHELENIPAQKCSLAVGFKPVREVVEEAKPSRLFVFDKKKDL